MTRGLYIAASGMLDGLRRQDSIANNLANVETPGYKRDVTISEAFPKMLLRRIHDVEEILPKLKIDRRPIIGSMGTGVLPTDVVQDFAQGAVVHTGNVLDLALVDAPVGVNQPAIRSFFAVQTPDGVRYTRNGSFSINSLSQLVTSEGYTLLDVQGQPIVLPQGGVQITEDGAVWQGATLLTTLQVVGIDPNGLTKQGDSLYVLGTGTVPGAAVPGSTVRSGYLEQSNINVVTEMVDMIAVLRAYEASQRAVRAQDDATEIAIQQVGRSR